MSIITRMRKQKCVYWPPGTPSGYGRVATSWGTPVECDCRWDDETHVVVDDAGEEVVAGSKVYIDRDVLKGGYLWLGEEDDLDSNHSDPTIIAGARRIVGFGKNPNMRATEFLRTAHLR